MSIRQGILSVAVAGMCPDFSRRFVWHALAIFTLMLGISGLSGLTCGQSLRAPVSFSFANGSQPQGAISNPYPVWQGWRGPGYYWFPMKGEEAGSRIVNLAELDAYNRYLFGEDLKWPYSIDQATAVAARQYQLGNARATQTPQAQPFPQGSTGDTQPNPQMNTQNAVQAFAAAAARLQTQLTQAAIAAQRPNINAANLAVGTAISGLIHPVITSVSKIRSEQTQQIVITGSGFGEQQPWSGDSPYIQISDLTRGWNAGTNRWPGLGGGDWTTIRVTKWTNSEIVISGFGGDYGQLGWVLRNGDKIEIDVWNAQVGKPLVNRAGVWQKPRVLGSGNATRVPCAIADGTVGGAKFTYTQFTPSASTFQWGSRSFFPSGVPLGATSENNLADALKAAMVINGKSLGKNLAIDAVKNTAVDEGAGAVCAGWDAFTVWFPPVDITDLAVNPATCSAGAAVGQEAISLGKFAITFLAINANLKHWQNYYDKQPGWSIYYFVDGQGDVFLAASVGQPTLGACFPSPQAQNPAAPPSSVFEIPSSDIQDLDQSVVRAVTKLAVESASAGGG